jgi:serine/threonine protein kinase
VRYLHAAGCAHLDLKLGNTFLDGDFEVRLGDFGTATFHPQPDDFKRDAFAFARIAWELITGAPLGKVSEAIGRSSLAWLGTPSNGFRSPLDVLHPGFLSLLRECWRPCHRDRPTFERILTVLTEIAYQVVPADRAAVDRYVQKLDDFEEKNPAEELRYE